MNISSCIERLPLLEDNCGIAFDALRADIEQGPFIGGETKLTVKFEVISTTGKIKHDITIKAAAYDESGAIIVTDSIHIYKDRFEGIDICQLAMYPSSDTIQKIRIFPVKGS